MQWKRVIASTAGAALVGALLAGCSDDGADGPGGASGGSSAVGEALGGSVPWWNEDVFYEVFVRSFRDSDGDGNGDLAGLIEELDHLNDGDPATDDDLGVTGLWLMPITASPSYHGYDATDFVTVEPDYGTNEDFRALVAAAHERGIAVIIDLMLNHTSSQHPWFLDSASGPGSAKRDWYVWSPDDPRQSTSWGTSAWHPSNGSYYLGLFWEGMPDLNYRNPAVTDQMYDVARFWIEEMGADGFRLDAVRHLIEEGDQFDGGPATHAWLAAWDDAIDGIDAKALTVGEVWDSTARSAAFVTGDEVDIAFEFNVASGILASVRSGDPKAFDTALAVALSAYPPGQFAPFLTNHDQDRVMSQLDGDVAGARLAASALLTLPGVPFVYYGEEIGMSEQKPDEMIRTPMQWSAESNAGFSSGAPWQPPNRDFAEVNVAVQEADPGSLLSHYRDLIRLRAEHSVLRVGGLRALPTSCPAVYSHLRTPAEGSDDDSVLVMLNFADAEQEACTVTATASTLAPGTYEVTDLLTRAPVAPLTVEDDGAFSGYAPLPSLGARGTAILLLRAS